VARLHLFEFEDQAWFPVAIRDLLTDFLSFFFRTFKPYACASAPLARALRATRSKRIIDLCAGAGQPVLSVLPLLEETGASPGEILLTDKYPNLEAFQAADESGGGVIGFVAGPVDATDVPPSLTGFRTLFTSFHHFRPAQAREILADAQRKGEGIGVFEFTERTLWLWTLPVLLIPAFVWLCTPFMRPFSWRRLFWTYMVPLVPLLAFWDGAVSNLRTYSPDELRELVEPLDDGSYRWEIGRLPSIGLSRVTYLVGWPEA
jgi:hypothetical protein